MSQPIVTAQLQLLERELDTRLFVRLGKQIIITDKGKQFLPYAQQILHSYQKGKYQLQSNGEIPNVLRIGSTVSIEVALLYDTLRGNLGLPIPVNQNTARSLANV